MRSVSLFSEDFKHISVHTKLLAIVQTYSPTPCCCKASNALIEYDTIKPFDCSTSKIYFEFHPSSFKSKSKFSSGEILSAKY